MHITNTKHQELTQAQREELAMFSRYVADYKKLIRWRLESFDKKGRVLVFYKYQPGRTELWDGRLFLMDMIHYFEEQDESFCYEICAKLKSVLDEYTEKFPKE